MWFFFFYCHLCEELTI